LVVGINQWEVLLEDVVTEVLNVPHASDAVPSVGPHASGQLVAVQDLERLHKFVNSINYAKYME
jgi:hypothetical protein